jgi:hypothetical protein
MLVHTGQGWPWLISTPSNLFKFSPTASDRPPSEVPEKIKKWREEQQLRLQEKDAAEEKAKEALRKQAEKELEDWYKRHEKTIAKTKTLNR